MTRIPMAATLLAFAFLVAPSASHRRLKIPVRRYRPSRPVVVAATAVIAAMAATLVPPSVVVSGGIAGGFVVSRVRRRRRHRFRLREGRVLAAALELLTGELGVGAHPVSALVTTAAESTGAVGDSLRAVASRAQLGADVVEGFRAVASSSPVPEYWNRLAVSWALAVDHGLTMSVLMRAAHRDIVERQRFADRTHAALAGARATAAILASLPVMGVLLGQLIGANPLRFLFGPGVGGALLIAGVSLICVGVVWADRIIDRLIA